MRRFVKWLMLSSAALGALLGAFLGGFMWLNWQPDRPVESLKARWAAAPSQFVQIGGLSVHVRDQGPRDDPLPILLVHGTSASLHTWEGWVATLAKTRRVVTMDLPGFGLTGPNASHDYRMPSYIRFVTGVADHLQIARFVIGGNSLGGEVAWNVAVAAPARVAQLILVDAAGYPFTPSSIPLGFRVARTPGLNVLMQNVLPRSIIESSVRNVYGDPARVTPELIDRYFDITLRAGNRRAVRERFGQLAHGTAAARITAIKVPTLILWGGRDRLIPPDNAHLFARDIAGSKLVMFDDLGHVPHEEDAARTVAAVQAFLATR